MIRIFENIDCMEGMEKYADLLKSRKVLAIVDPPYGINAANKINIGKRRNTITYTNYDKKNWDAKKPSKKYFAKLFYSSTNQIIWGGNYFSDCLPNSRGWIFWDKKFCEKISFSKGELAFTSFDRVLEKIEINNSEWKNCVSNNPEKALENAKIHPCQKPIALYKWLLEKYSAEHDLILDTHVGSASSLIACEDFGIDYIGFELDEDYYKMANERLLKARFEREAKVSETCVTKGLALFE